MIAPISNTKKISRLTAAHHTQRESVEAIRSSFSKFHSTQKQNNTQNSTQTQRKLCLFLLLKVEKQKQKTNKSFHIQLSPLRWKPGDLTQQNLSNVLTEDSNGTGNDVT